MIGPVCASQTLIDKCGGRNSGKVCEVRIESISLDHPLNGSRLCAQMSSTDRTVSCVSSAISTKRGSHGDLGQGRGLKDTRAFIEHLQRLDAEGCRWLVVPLAEEESSGSFRCSKCEMPAADAAPLYSLATHIAFEQEVLCAIEASHSFTEYEDRISRIVEEEPTPML